MDAFKILVETLKTGGPYAITAIFVFFYLRERAYAQKLNADILSMAVKSTEAAVTTTATLNALKDMIGSLRDLIRQR